MTSALLRQIFAGSEVPVQRVIGKAPQQWCFKGIGSQGWLPGDFMEGFAGFGKPIS
jgi:hypothetical protein